jgi:rhodanese-related sulfurtransferase
VPATIDRDRVVQLVEHYRAQLVEVLPRHEYEEEHLPGAIHLPLKSLDRSAIDAIDRARPVAGP